MIGRYKNQNNSSDYFITRNHGPLFFSTECVHHYDIVRYIELISCFSVMYVLLRYSLIGTLANIFFARAVELGRPPD